MKEICVVHLVRASNGIEPFARFLDSYRVNPGGIDHHLLVIFKGFESPQDSAEYRRMLVSFAHKILEVSDEGVDITAYCAAVRHYGREYRYFCFLNSYSIILDHDWLKKLYENISKPEIGLVGATGSWVSHRTNVFTHLRNPMAYLRSLWPKYNPEMKNYTPKPVNSWKKAISVLEWLWHLPFYVWNFDAFPNYFIRTNAFMVSGELMESLSNTPIKTKMDAYIFESGKTGITRKILAMGKKVLVVGKDGNGYSHSTWNESKTLFQSNQENLLIADNRTCDYQYGSPQRRRYLSLKTWC